MKVNKLVRDKIPEFIDKKGYKPIYHVASKEEYDKSLMDKLSEEVEEFKQDPSLEELADIMEVLNVICTLKGINLDALEEIQENKFEALGGFEEGIILEDNGA